MAVGANNVVEKEVLTASIAAFATIVVSIVGGLFAFIASRSRQVREGKEKVDQVERELQFKRDALGLAEFVEEWENLRAEVLRLIDETCIDRFILFRAWNGKYSPRWTTGIYQIRSSDQTVTPYISYEMDSDYQGRLIATMRNKSHFIDVGEIVESDVKAIYDAEGVKQSFWCHIINLALSGSDSRAIVYCSFATHSDEDIGGALRLRCSLLSSRFKGLAIHMHSGIGDLDET